MTAKDAKSDVMSSSLLSSTLKVVGLPQSDKAIEPSTIHGPLPDDGDGIRLLYLLPGDSGSVIKANLKAVKLSANPQYECISYVWGASQTAEHIRVNGVRTSVRRNLGTFLRKLRPLVDSRALWVDALCISQTDDIEKMQQVQIIGRIFQRASRVLAWVGDQEDDDSHQIFDHARRYTYGWAETQHLERQGLKLDVMALEDQLSRFSQAGLLESNLDRTRDRISTIGNSALRERPL